jgi:phage gp37-like protein
MAGTDLKTLEDAVIDCLQSALGEQVETLESFQGDWRASLRAKPWRFPAVLVMLQQSRGEQVTLRSCDLNLDFTVLVMGRALRGEAEARRRPGGAYELLAGVRQALWQQDLGLEMLPCALLKEEPLLNDQEFSVYGAYYRTALVAEFP